MHRKETSTELLFSHIIVLFSGTLLALHVILGIKYFYSEGANIDNSLGFLNYVKSNADSMPIESVQLRIQERNNIQMNQQEVSLFRWAGNTKGYKCGDIYQTHSCSNTNGSKILEIPSSSPRNLLYMSFTDAEGKEYLGNLQIKRCREVSCSGSAINDSINNSNGVFVNPKITLSKVNGVSNIYDVLLNGQPSFIFKGNANPNQNLFYSFAINPIDSPCLNTFATSQLPSIFKQFTLYSALSCDRFNSISNAVPLNISQSTLNLSIFKFFQDNQISQTLLSAGLTFPSSTITPPLQLFLIPKISITQQSSSCIVTNDLSSINSFVSTIQMTGLTIFIIRQVLVVLMFPLPFVENSIRLFSRKKKKIKKIKTIGIFSKLLVVLVFLSFIIEGAIIQFWTDKKIQLYYHILAFGAINCSNDPYVNKGFQGFPTLFSDSLEEYCYLTYIFMWTSITGICYLVILSIKIGLDLYVLKKKQHYGEYDAGDNSEEQCQELQTFEERSDQVFKQPDNLLFNPQLALPLIQQDNEKTTQQQSWINNQNYQQYQSIPTTSRTGREQEQIYQVGNSRQLQISRIISGIQGREMDNIPQAQQENNQNYDQNSD